MSREAMCSDSVLSMTVSASWKNEKKISHTKNFRMINFQSWCILNNFSTKESFMNEFFSFTMLKAQHIDCVITQWWLVWLLLWILVLYFSFSALQNASANLVKLIGSRHTKVDLVDRLHYIWYYISTCANIFGHVLFLAET